MENEPSDIFDLKSTLDNLLSSTLITFDIDDNTVNSHNPKIDIEALKAAVQKMKELNLNSKFVYQPSAKFPVSKNNTIGDKKLSKKIIVSSSDEQSYEQMIREKIASSITIDFVDDTHSAIYYAAAYSAYANNSACKHFVHSSMRNPVDEFKYANTVGINHCSHSIFSQSSNPPACIYGGKLSNCFISFPYFEILKVTKANDVTYILVKQKDLTSSYIYRIIDTNNNLYHNLTYSDISENGNDISDSALQVFNSYISEISSFSEDLHYSFVDSNVQQKTQKTGYLASLIS